MLRGQAVAEKAPTPVFSVQKNDVNVKSLGNTASLGEHALKLMEEQAQKERVGRPASGLLLEARPVAHTPYLLAYCTPIRQCQS